MRLRTQAEPNLRDAISRWQPLRLQDAPAKSTSTGHWQENSAKGGREQARSGIPNPKQPDPSRRLFLPHQLARGVELGGDFLAILVSGHFVHLLAILLAFDSF
jgi:hypothetical protein